MATTHTTTTAPDYIERDTYAGRWTVQKRNAVADTYLVEELAEFADSNDRLVLWTSAGRMAGTGRELFGRMRFVVDAAGNLHGFDSRGEKKIVHPVGRELRILTTR